MARRPSLPELRRVLAEKSVHIAPKKGAPFPDTRRRPRPWGAVRSMRRVCSVRFVPLAPAFELERKNRAAEKVLADSR